MYTFFTIAFAQSGPIASAPRVSHILTNILQFLLSIVGVVAIIAVVIAGLMYFFAAGDQRQAALAKKILLAAITGIVIALGGLVIIRALAAFV